MIIKWYIDLKSALDQPLPWSYGFGFGFFFWGLLLFEAGWCGGINFWCSG